MRQLAWVLLCLAAVAFLVGTYSAFGGVQLLGHWPVTYWRGAVGLVLFAITLRLLERDRN